MRKLFRFAIADGKSIEISGAPVNGSLLHPLQTFLEKRNPRRHVCVPKRRLLGASVTFAFYTLD